MLTPEAKEARKNSIGGSEVAGVLGFSKWSSPLKVYFDKTGLLPGMEETIRLLVGSLMEPVVAKLTNRRLRELDAESEYQLVTDPHGMIEAIKKYSTCPEKLTFEVYSEENEFGEIVESLIVKRTDVGHVHATPDGILICISTNQAWVQESKTSEFFVRSEWDDGIPVYYKSQGVHNAAVLGFSGTSVSVLIGYSDFRFDFVDGAERPLDNLRFLEAWFKRCVIGGDEPDAMPQDLKAIKSVYGEAGGDRVQLTEIRDAKTVAKILALDEKYPIAHQAEKDAKAIKDGVKARICQLMGNADSMNLGNGVSWTNKANIKKVRSAKRSES